jgi:nucleoside-diphosphate kinase
VIVCCLQGKDAVKVVRSMAGVTNGRDAAPGTIRGDYSMSIQENIIHASDSVETAAIELKRFFKDEEIFEYTLNPINFLYAGNEITTNTTNE